MGRNKDLRKKIGAEISIINKHLDKIAAELAKPYPNHERIAKWRKDIDNHHKALDRLSAKLPERRRK